jgi:hypothetical protein
MTHQASRPGHPGTYALTAAGQALTPVIWAMGAWTAEWMFGDPGEEHCDGLTLIWRTHQVAIAAKLPETRTVVHLVLTGAGGAQGWLDIRRPVVVATLIAAVPRGSSSGTVWPALRDRRSGGDSWSAADAVPGAVAGTRN